MVKLFWGLFRASRPRQWIKNFAVFAGLIFSGTLFDPTSQLKTLEAFLLFCIFSSATYFLNDVFDIERDKLHPFKRKRPIASGLIPIPLAVTVSLAAIVIFLPLSYKLSPAFFFAALTYLIMQLFYSAYLKQIILIDVLPSLLEYLSISLPIRLIIYAVGVLLGNRCPLKCLVPAFCHQLRTVFGNWEKKI